MPSMRAYLDDFGKITVFVSRNFYGGRSDGFYITSDKKYNSELVVNWIEELPTEIKYVLTGPTGLSFASQYMIREAHGLAVPLEYRLIVQTKQFNERFFYDEDDLGAVYHRMHTDFALWAPTASGVLLKVTQNGKVRAYSMNRTDKGVWRMSVIGDLKNATYVYLVERNGTIKESLDPYALSSTGNGRESAVIDLSEIETISDNPLSGHISGTDAIIYETSVRDMTASPFTGTREHSTFGALSEEGTSLRNIPTGLDYLASLGVTHIQLLPVMDFATVDEYNPRKNYNWGYDPAQYLTPEGSYSSDPDDPYARVAELRAMVAALHKKGLRVNLDVVFNHMYSVEGSPFDNAVPYYYFRYNSNANPSNGSFCGNDFASEQPMARKYIVHVIRRIMEIYHVDGFRFDLMGLLDTETMNEIRKAALEINPDAMIYGEGWDMPTILPSEQRASIMNHAKMPGVGHFNDYFRDVIKGKTADDQKYDKGYATGDFGEAFNTLSALAANVLDTPYFKRFDDPAQSINSIETHDNSTAWDKMHSCCGNEDRATRQKRQKMLIALGIFGQGVPFIHAGMEFCGTKNDNSNSFNAGDDINQMDWLRAEINASIIEYTRKCIRLRHKYSGFRLKTAEEIKEKLALSVSEGSVLFYDINHKANGIEQIRVLVNPSFDHRSYDFPEEYRVVLNADGSASPDKSRHVELPPLCVIVCVR